MKILYLLPVVALFLAISHGQSREKYADSAVYYFNKSKSAGTADSLVFTKGLRLLDSIQHDAGTVRILKDAAESFQSLGKPGFRNAVYMVMFRRLVDAHAYDEAIVLAKEILEKYESSTNPADRTLFLQILADLRVPFRVTDRLKEGFDFYTGKLAFYLQRDDSAAISVCYFVNGGFYRTNGLKDLAIYNLKKSLLYLDVNDTYDSESVAGLYGYINNLSVLGQLYNSLGDYANGILYSRAALQFGNRALKDSGNLSYIYKNIAYAKIMMNDVDSVQTFLNKGIELADGPGNAAYKASCYLVKGMYFLKTNGLDSSLFYLEKCKRLMIQDGINANSVAGSINPGYYLALVKLQQNRIAEAGQLLQEEIPGLLNLREELIGDYRLLVEVYLKSGDVRQANETFVQYTNLQEQLQADERNNRKLSFETEQKIAEAENTIGRLTSERKIATLTRNYLTGIAVLLFIIALGIYNRFRVTRKQKTLIEQEKQRSESLLLNILPSEVAEELKAKGRAEARQFDRVTVMFTDFKNFTQISENLTPSELVAEIHACFEAFDHIVARHNIEKIKTIGDSYMCAGGLPVENKTNATDVVLAALEIQEYMQQRLKSRKTESKALSEIRIGIHTGPVVAGIVGVKKFAYDIWGDTVNIASRMESSGEAGKINISGSTYELIKDEFQCVARGKVAAKNKGEINMYFVEGKKSGEGSRGRRWKIEDRRS